MFQVYWFAMASAGLYGEVDAQGPLEFPQAPPGDLLGESVRGALGGRGLAAGATDSPGNEHGSGAAVQAGAFQTQRVPRSSHS